MRSLPELLADLKRFGGQADTLATSLNDYAKSIPAELRGPFHSLALSLRETGSAIKAAFAA
jgi:hypothetical protein